MSRLTAPGRENGRTKWQRMTCSSISQVVSIFKRWDESYKKLLRDSRILTTRNLVEAIPESSAEHITLISTSAVGYYGMTQDVVHSENSRPGTDFLALLARDWEAEALQAQTKGTRVVITRFGVVLGKDAGALPQMALPFRFFVGGPVGHGRQWVSWIHIEDLCQAMLFVMETPSIRGPVNFTAPEPVRNGEMSKAIGKALHRPSFMPAPGFMIKLVLGEFGSVILEGQRVVPSVLLQSGFTFRYPHIDSCAGQSSRRIEGSDRNPSTRDDQAPCRSQHLQTLISAIFRTSVQGNSVPQLRCWGS